MRTYQPDIHTRKDIANYTSDIIITFQIEGIDSWQNFGKYIGQTFPVEGGGIDFTFTRCKKLNVPRYALIYNLESKPYPLAIANYLNQSVSTIWVQCYEDVPGYAKTGTVDHFGNRIQSKSIGGEFEDLKKELNELCFLE